MTTIDATAVVDARAQIADDVRIGSYCVIQGPVVIGRGCVLYPHVTILGNTILGEDNHVFPGAVIGAEPQDLKHDGALTRLEIGDHNRIREHVTMHPGTRAGGGVTVLESHGLFMVGCHVAHDCRIGNHVILANHVLLAGHITVGDRAVLNGASACHHFTSVGRLAYVGGLTRITQDVHPFTVVEGHPARVRGANTVGLQRAGIDAARIAIVKRAIYSLFLSDRETSAEVIVRLEREYGDEPLVCELIASVCASHEGRQGRAAERARGMS